MVAFFMMLLRITMTRNLYPARVLVTGHWSSSPSGPNVEVYGMLMLPGMCPRLKLHMYGQGPYECIYLN